MKKLIFGLIATVMIGFVGCAQTIKDFLVKSKISITQTSQDGLYNKFVGKLVLPNGIEIVKSDNFALYTLNNANYQMIEVPVLSERKIVNFMFVVLDLNQNSSKVIFKNHQEGNYEFFDENLEKLYSFNFTDNNINFDNETGTTAKSCYSKCRTAAYAAIEGDWLSDLACSINPCGAAIAIYCGLKC